MKDSVHATSEEFKNEGFTHHASSVSSTLRRRNLKTQQSLVILDFHMTVHRFQNALFSNVFRPHKNKNLAFSNPSGLNSVFEKLRFRDGLVWTVGLTVEIKPTFSNFPGVVWTLPK